MASKESQEVNGELYSKNADTLNKDELISEDGKNMKWVVCQFCGSKVLRPNSGRYLEREVSIEFFGHVRRIEWFG